MLKSANLGLNIFEGNDNVKRTAFVENFEILDKMYGPVVEQASETVHAIGTNNTFVVTSDTTLKAYYKGFKRIIFFDKDWTGAGTINFDGIGAKYIKDCYGTIQTNLKGRIPYHICYNGQDFILLGKGGGGNAQPNHVLENYAFTNDAGPQRGSMKNNGKKIFTPGRSNIELSEFYENGSYIKGDTNLISNNIMRDRTIFDVAGNCDLSDYAKNQLNNAITNVGGTTGSDLNGIINNIESIINLGTPFTIPKFNYSNIKEDTRVVVNVDMLGHNVPVSIWYSKGSSRYFYASYIFPIDVKAKISVSSRENYVGAESMVIKTKKLDILIGWITSNTTINDSKRNTNDINSISFKTYTEDRNLNEMSNRDAIVFY